jgi:hypothetical protein
MRRDQTKCQQAKNRDCSDYSHALRLLPSKQTGQAGILWTTRPASERAKLLIGNISGSLFPLSTTILSRPDPEVKANGSAGAST